MDNIRFLKNGTQVKLVREFWVGSTHLAEVTVGFEDESTVLLYDDLFVKYEFYQLEKQGVKDKNEKGKDVKSPQTFKVEDGDIASYINISNDGIELSTGAINLDGAVVPETPVKNESVAPQQMVTAINNKGKRTKLGNIGDLSESKDVKRLKLDHEAIIRVINGEQKQHKGYTFEVK